MQDESHAILGRKMPLFSYYSLGFCFVCYISVLIDKMMVILEKKDERQNDDEKRKPVCSWQKDQLSESLLHQRLISDHSYATTDINSGLLANATIIPLQSKDSNSQSSVGL